MATNGIVSLVNKHGETLVKCICGCDGYNATDVAVWLKENQTLDIEAIYKQCLFLDFGCTGCLVVMDSKEHFFENERFQNDDLAELYCQTFSTPKFNPRWENGTAPYIEVVVFASGPVLVTGDMATPA
jgi:uncharacterized Rmd1/YagE family protein